MMPNETASTHRPLVWVRTQVSVAARAKQPTDDTAVLPTPPRTTQAKALTRRASPLSAEIAPRFSVRSTPARPASPPAQPWLPRRSDAGRCPSGPRPGHRHRASAGRAPRRVRAKEPAEPVAAPSAQRTVTTWIEVMRTPPNSHTEAWKPEPCRPNARFFVRWDAMATGIMASPIPPMRIRGLGGALDLGPLADLVEDQDLNERASTAPRRRQRARRAPGPAGAAPAGSRSSVGREDEDRAVGEVEDADGAPGGAQTEGEQQIDRAEARGGDEFLHRGILSDVVAGWAGRGRPAHLRPGLSRPRVEDFSRRAVPLDDDAVDQEAVVLEGEVGSERTGPRPPAVSPWRP